MQIIQGTTDFTLLDVIPNAPDGAALFSATDGGGAPRFGVAGGNVVTGSGVVTPDNIRTDFFEALERMASFVNPKGEPALDPTIIDQGVCLIYGIGNTKVVREAFVQGRSVQVTQNVGGTENVAATTPTNIILDSGIPVRLKGTSRNNFNPKPIFSQVVEALSENTETESNSDRARRTKIEGIFWDAIKGYGVNLPLGAVQIDN